MKRTYFIYKLTSPSGKVYIGQTYNINRRFSSYRNLNCKKQIKLYSSIKKYGWINFKKEIIHDLVCDRKTADEWEEKEILKYYSKGISLNTNIRVNSPCYSELGNHPRSRAVLKLDLDLNIIKEYSSIQEACSEIGVSNSTLSRACRTDNFYSSGYYWRYSDKYSHEDALRLKIKPNKNSKPVYQYSKKGLFIKRWNSQSEASKQLNIKQANIWKCLNKDALSAGGFMWFRSQQEAIDLLFNNGGN